MAIAFDAFSISGTFTTSTSWTHTPVGTPRGVIVYVVCNPSTDQINLVQYGGVVMTQKAFVTHSGTGTEPGGVYSFFLGSGIPTGAQTVNISDTGISTCQAYAITITAASDTSCPANLTDGFVDNPSVTDPSFTIPLNSRSSFCSLALFSGQQAATGITPLANWTARDETDFGSQQAACYTYNTIGTTDVTAGWTQTAEDAAYAALAVAEATLPTVTSDSTDTIAATSVNANGNITSIGTDAVTTRGFIYSIRSHPDPGNVSPIQTGYEGFAAQGGSFDTGTYSVSITGLQPSTTYYVRAFAQSEAGQDYGNTELSFTTLAQPGHEPLGLFDPDMVALGRFYPNVTVSGNEGAFFDGELVDTVTSAVSRAPAVGSMTLTGTTPVRSIGSILLPAAASLVLTGTAVIAKLAIALSPAAGTLALSGTTPVASIQQVAQPAVGSLNLTGTTPNVQFFFVSSPAVGSLNLTGTTPIVSQGINALPAVGSLTLSGTTPTANVGVTSAPAVGSLALSGTTPALFTEFKPFPAVGSLTFTGLAPAALNGITATPAVGSLTFTGQTPNASLGLNSLPAVGSLTLSGQTPNLQFFYVASPAVASLSLAGVAPLSSIGIVRQPAEGTLALSGTTSSLKFTFVASPAAGTLTLDGQTPAVIGNGAKTPAEASLTLSGLAPNAQLFLVASPAAGTLALSGTTAVPAFTIFPAAGSLVISGQAPAANQGVTGAPAVGALTLSGTTSIIKLAFNLTPSAGTLTFTGLAPVSLERHNRLPAVGSLTLTGLLPGVAAGNLAAPAVGTLTLSGVTPSAKFQFFASPAVGSLALSGLAPTLTGTDTLFPAVGALSFTGLTPGVLAGNGKVPGVGTLTLTGLAAQVIPAAFRLPASGTLSLSGLTPALYYPYAVPDAGSLGLTGLAPVRSIINPLPPLGLASSLTPADYIAGSASNRVPVGGAVSALTRMTSETYREAVLDAGAFAYWRLEEPFLDAGLVDEISPTAYSAEVSADSSYVYFRLNEDSGSEIFDQNGNVTVTLSSSVGVGYLATGAFGESGDPGMSFTGVGAGFHKASITPQLDRLTTFTVEAWIKPAAGGPTTQAIIFEDIFTSLLPHGLALVRVVGGSKLAWSNGASGLTNHTTTLLDGQFYHVVFSVTDGLGTFYVNGVQGPTVSALNPAGDGPAFNAMFHDVGSHPFEGTVDDLAVYQSALTTAQVYRHYHRSNPASFYETGVTLSQTGAVDSGLCPLFNGTGAAYVGVPKVGIQANATIAAWIRPTSVTGEKTIFSIRATGSASNQNRPWMGIVDGKLQVGSFDSGLGIPQTLTSLATIPTNQWTHVAWVGTAATSSLYINGAMDTGGPVVKLFFQGPGWIGGDVSRPGEAVFEGYIDDLAIFSTILTGVQVSALYNLNATDARNTAKGTATITKVGGTAIVTTIHP